MRFLTGIFLFVSLIISGCSDKIIRIVRTTSFNPEWQFSEAGKTNWLPAKVPGVVQTDLLLNGKIDNPLFSDNETRLQWISENDWQYRTYFDVNDSLLGFKSVDFIFKGIDTYASVLLNDSLIISADNMFREWRADGKKFLKRGKNELKIVLYSPSRRGQEAMSKLKYRLPMSSDAAEIKVSSFVRKAPYHFGWDWSPRFLTMGIWQPIAISAHDRVYISGIQVKTIEIADTCAWLSANVTINSHSDFPNATITILDGFKQFRLKKGITTTLVQFKIDQPELWWPNGYGKQPLYDLTARLYINAYLVDTITCRTGIRTIELFQDEDEWGNSFYFRVNGLPVFMKGANYVPQSNFLTGVTPADYIRIVDDVKSVGMNMLRVWGGGIYENDAFYDLCDENGILVWQDLMFANSMYPGDSMFVKNVELELKYQVGRLRNHPSVAMWCGNNEINVAWHNWGWQKELSYTPADSAVVYGDYLSLFENKIPEWLSTLDDTRPYIPSSPISNWGRHENFGTGNMHYWGVWHGEESIDSFRVFVPRFMTEYGMQSFPSFKSLKKNTGDERITLGSDFIRHRQKSYKGNRLLINYIEQEYGAVKNTEALCYLSQLNQATAMRTAIESHRRDARYCMGTLYWQLNDVWDGASWSTLEHNGTWKAAHYHLRELYARDILIAETKNDTTLIFLQSDNISGTKGKLRVDVLDFKGRSLGSYWSEAATGYLVATKVFQMPLSKLLRGNDKYSFFLKISLISEDTIIAQSTHHFSRTKDLKLMKPEIRSEIEATPEIYKIKLFSHTLVKNVMLEFKNTDGKFSDNYFDLLPGEEKLVTFEALNAVAVPAELVIASYWDYIQK